MIEIAVLPLDLKSSCKPAFPVGDRFSRVESVGKGDDPMQVIGHGEDASPVPIAALFPELDGLNQFGPYFGFGELIAASWKTVDRDEECLLSWIDPVRHIMGKVRPAEIRHGDQKVAPHRRGSRSGSAAPPGQQVKGARKGSSCRAGWSSQDQFFLDPLACAPGGSAPPRVSRRHFAVSADSRLF